MSSSIQGEQFSCQQVEGKTVATLIITKDAGGRTISPIEITQTYAGTIDPAAAKSNLEAVAAKMVLLADVYRLGEKTDTLTLQGDRLTKHYKKQKQEKTINVKEDLTKKAEKYAHKDQCIAKIQEKYTNPEEIYTHQKKISELALEAFNISPHQTLPTITAVRLQEPVEIQDTDERLLAWAEQLKQDPKKFRIKLSEEGLELVPRHHLTHLFRYVFKRGEDRRAMEELIKYVEMDLWNPFGKESLRPLIDVIKEYDPVKGAELEKRLNLEDIPDSDDDDFFDDEPEAQLLHEEDINRKLEGTGDGENPVS